MSKKQADRRSFLKQSLSALAAVSVFSGATLAKSNPSRIWQNQNKNLAPRDFSSLLANPPAGFSRKTLENHLGLYRKYINGFNKVNQKLESQENINHDNLIKKGFNYSGVILHELYFRNITSKPEQLGYKSLLSDSIQRLFGSVNNFLDLFAKAGASSRGWTVFGFNLFTTNLEIYSLDSHNEGSSLTFIWPVLVLDVYEHAYLIDHGTNKAAYVNNFINQIDWSILEKRFEQGISVLEKRDLFV